MSSQLEDAFNEAVERRVAEIRAQDAAPFFTEQQERALSRCEGYDEGFAAGSSAERARLAEALRERAKREIACRSRAGANHDPRTRRRERMSDKRTEMATTLRAMRARLAIIEDALRRDDWDEARRTLNALQDDADEIKCDMDEIKLP